MNSSLQVGDFQNICRLCLFPKEHMVLISTHNVANMIQSCCSVQVMDDDGLPHQICSDCYNQLGSSFGFKRQCEHADEILRQIVSNTPKIEDSKADIKPIVECKKETIAISDNTCDYESYKSEDSWSSSHSDKEGGNATKTDYGDVKEPKPKIHHRKSLMDILITKYNIRDLTCNICNKELCSRPTLLRHMETHDACRPFKLHCPVCSKGFYETGNLNKHMNRHKGNAQYKCDECPRQFYELSALATHARRKHQSKPIKCSSCCLEFYHRLQLEQHATTHEEKQFECDICGRVYPRMFKLKLHQIAHSTVRPYKCRLCEKTFKFKHALATHVRIYHSETQPREVCNVCGKSMLQSSLKTHMLTHNRQVLYKCDECPKQYTRADHLNAHVRAKHRNEVKPFNHLCNVCGKGFHWPRHLRVHMAAHTGEKSYPCELCNKTYRTPCSVTAHVRTAHKDERPHSCTLCSKAFHTTTILKNHMRTHTGERPFKCPVCGRRFGSKSVLNTHLKTHS